MSDKFKMKPLSFTFSEIEQIDEEGKDRKFRGVAYTGNVIPQWGWTKNIIVDLENASFKDQVPILLNHDPDQIAGHANFKVENNEVIAEGVIYNDEIAGERIKRLADKGHQWEMSIHAQGDSVLLLGENEKKMVNGRLLEGEHHIIQNPMLREASFVTFGADKDTNASLFSRWFGGSEAKKEEIKDELNIVKLNETSEGKNMEELELLKKKNEELTAELSEIKAEIAEKAKAELEVEVEAKFSGLEVSEEDKNLLTVAFMSGDENQIKIADKVLATLGEKAPEKTEAEIKAEEEAKVKAEAEAKLAASKKAALPDNLFTADKGADESLAALASSKKDLYTLGEELAKKENISLTEAIVKVRQAQVS